MKEGAVPELRKDVSETTESRTTTECIKKRERRQVIRGWEEEWGVEGVRENCLEESRTMFNTGDNGQGVASGAGSQRGEEGLKT